MPQLPHRRHGESGGTNRGRGVNDAPPVRNSPWRHDSRTTRVRSQAWRTESLDRSHLSGFCSGKKGATLRLVEATLTPSLFRSITHRHDPGRLAKRQLLEG